MLGQWQSVVLAVTLAMAVIGGLSAYTAPGRAATDVRPSTGRLLAGQQGATEQPASAASSAAADEEPATPVDMRTQLWVLDVADPATPTIVGVSEPLPGLGSGLTVSHGVAYVGATLGGLHILDVQDPQAPHHLSTLPQLSAARRPSVQGRYAYVPDGRRGLRIVDVLDPAHPLVIGRFTPEGPATQVVASGYTAYVLDDKGTLSVVDMWYPGAPKLLSSFSLRTFASDLAVSGDYVYVAAGSDDSSGGLHVIDVSDRRVPREVGLNTGPAAAAGVALDDERAYVATEGLGLYVVDVREPTHPQETGHVMGLGTGGVALSGGYAFVANDACGLQILDLGDADHPAVVGHVPGHVRDVAISGSYAYVLVSSPWAQTGCRAL